MLSIEILTWTEKYLVYIFCCPPVCRCFSSQSWPLDGSPFLSIGTIIISQNQYELTFVLLYFCCCCFRSTFFPALFFLMYSSTIRHSNRFLVCPGSKSMDQIKIVLKIRSSTAFPLSAFVYVCVYFAQEISINWIKKITEASTIAMQTKTMGESCVFTSTIYINDFRCFSNTLSHGLHESDSTDPRIVWSGRKKSANKQINKNRKLNERKETKREWKKLWDNSTQILTAYKSFRCKNANKRSSYETENVVKMVKRRFNCWNVQIEPIIGLTSIHIPFLFAHAYPWSTSLFGQQFCLLII